MAEERTFLSSAGTSLDWVLWPAEGETKGVVQIVHGMCEHIERYAPLAAKLNAAGYAVAGHNQLGHGKRASALGYFSESGGWDALIKDVHILRGLLEKEYPSLPIFLMGHSMGSFVVRTYCLQHEAGLRGVILSGTGYYPSAVVASGKLIASLQCLFGMKKKPSKLLEGISFGGYLKRIPDAKTPFDWLTRDEEIVQAYIDDPLCGFTFTGGAYRDMFDGLSRLAPKHLSTLKEDIPVLFFAGGDDPVGSYGAGVQKVADEWKAQGVKDLTVKLYPEGRHEMHNEMNSGEVIADLVAWLDKH